MCATEFLWKRATLLGSLITKTVQGTNEIESCIAKARATIICLQTCLWSRREISLRTKFRVYLVVVCVFLFYESETWPLGVVDAVFDSEEVDVNWMSYHRFCYNIG